MVIIDDRLDDVEKGVEENKQIVDSLENNIDLLSKKVKNVNSDLKASLHKMRKPDKLFIDLCLFFTLAVMIGVLFWSVKFYWGLEKLD